MSFGNLTADKLHQRLLYPIAHRRPTSTCYCGKPVLNLHLALLLFQLFALKCVEFVFNLPMATKLVIIPLKENIEEVLISPELYLATLRF